MRTFACRALGEVQGFKESKVACGVRTPLDLRTRESTMRAPLFSSLVVLGLMVACSGPNTDLFAPGPSEIVEPSAGGRSSNAGASAVGGKESPAGGAQALGGADGGAPDRPSGGEAGVGGAGGAKAGAGGGGTGSGLAGGGGGNAGGGAGRGGNGGAAGRGGNGGNAGNGEPPKPVCGNGKLEAGEECDDAGQAGPDGCNAECEVACSDYGPETRESEDHHCYAGFSARDFAGAQLDCVARGSHLATISSIAESELAAELVINSKWIGGHEDVPPTERGTQDYQWLTDEAFDYTNWADDQPDGAKYRCGLATRCYEHCVVLLPDGTWADQRCDEPDGYICEWEPAGAR